MCHSIANADTHSCHEEAFCSSGVLKSSHQEQHIAPPSVVFERTDTTFQSICSWCRYCSWTWVQVPARPGLFLFFLFLVHYFWNGFLICRFQQSISKNRMVLFYLGSFGNFCMLGFVPFGLVLSVTFWILGGFLLIMFVLSTCIHAMPTRPFGATVKILSLHTIFCKMLWKVTSNQPFLSCTISYENVSLMAWMKLSFASPVCRQVKSGS